MSNRRILVLVVAVLALVTPLAAPPVAAQAEEADSWTDDQGCQYDRMDFGATIWSCPDGSSGADWEDGSGNENAASGCSREWSSVGEVKTPQPGGAGSVADLETGHDELADPYIDGG